jgi:PAS domain S-box-containing protein
VSLVTITTSVLAVWGAWKGLGPFAGRPEGVSLILLQVFMGVVAITGMLLAASTSERQALGRREAIVHSLGKVLGASSSLEGGATAILQTLVTALRMDEASLWLTAGGSGSLCCTHVHPGTAPGDGAVEQSPGRRDRLRRKVLETGRPAWSATAGPGGARPRTVFVFSIRALKTNRGVIQLTRSGAEEPDEDLLSLLAAIGGQIGLFVERTEAETAFCESETRLRLAVEAGRMGTWEWTPATGRVVWSASLESIHGLEPGTFAGTFEAVLSEVHPDDRDGLLRAIREAQEELTGHHVEYRICLPDGTIRWVEGRGKVLLDESGRLSRMVGVCADVTDRKLAEAKLRESEERFRVMAEAVPDILFTTRADGWCEYVSPRFYEYSGLPQGAAEGLGWLEALHGEDAPRVRDRWMDAVASASPFEIRYRLRSLSGEYRWFVARALPIRDAAGVALKWFGAATDVHDLVVAQEGLRAADRRKDEFLAMLAHELRNPLAPIRNATHFLCLGEDEGAARRARDVIERQVDHLGHLVDDLLDVSRITSGKVQLRRRIVTAAAVVERAVETVEPLARARRQELDVSLPAEPIFLNADIMRLSQVVANLLSNAVKYTPEEGKVALSVEREEEEMVLRVKDTGIGIPPHKLREVFELFTQLDPSLERTEGGLGIGLTLVRSLVQMHGGTVEAFSEGIGKGSEFTVRLPVSPERIEEMEEAAAAKPLPRRILVVDDNVDAAETLARVLKHRRHDVRTANDGTSALRMASDFLPDVVFLDIGLPDLNGFEVARRLRSRPGSRPLLLVALTGYGQGEVRRRAMEAGFDHHVLKPVSPDVLEGILATS